jgi:hypothetical protein
MLNKYNFMNIISAALAAVTGGLYLYTIFPDYFKQPISSAIIYTILFFMVCVFAGRVKKSVWNVLDKKWFYIMESILFLCIPVYFIMNGFINYWNTAGIILLGYMVIYVSSTIRENIIKMVIILFSPLFYYGLLFQHSFFTESIFAISFLLLMDKMLKRESVDQYFYMSAIILAFLVFVNPFLIILFLVFLGYSFRQELKRGMIFLMTAAVSFYFMNALLRNQSAVLFLPNFSFSFGIILLVIFILLMSVYAGWISRNIYSVFFSAAVIMFITIMIYNSVLPIFHATLLSVIYPLLIFGIKDNSTKEYLGVILAD